MNANECCGNCRFFDWSLAAINEDNSRAHFSFCDRYPPVYVGTHGDWMEASKTENWVRPFVSEVEYCGEFQPQPKREGEGG